MVFEQQYPVAGFRQDVGAGQAAQAAANHDYIILVGDAFEPVVSHAEVGAARRLIRASARG